MIDIHCHMLPGVDDGAEDMHDALEMARMAAAGGTKALIVTPHCNLPGAPEKNYASQALATQFALLQNAVLQAQIPLTLALGAEILCTPDLDILLRKALLPTLAGSRYLLAEFFFDESLEYMQDHLSCIAAHGLVPVIAHPERYSAVQCAPYVAEDWFSRGYVLQINKGSVLGRLGRHAAKTADYLLERGLAHVLASDGHSPEVRTPHMGALQEFLEDNCSASYARILLEDNPARILTDQPVLEA